MAAPLEARAGVRASQYSDKLTSLIMGFDIEAAPRRACGPLTFRARHRKTTLESLALAAGGDTRRAHGAARGTRAAAGLRGIASGADDAPRAEC